MIDLCKIFGVEEGEEFRIKHKKCVRFIYKIVGDSLMFRGKEEKDFWFSDLSVNALLEIENIIKLPKKKEFTDDALSIFRKIPKEYKWCARDKSKNFYAYKEKPQKLGEIWNDERCTCECFNLFEYLFPTILWEDEEPVFIDDYVERK